MNTVRLRDRRDLCRTLGELSKRQHEALAGRDYDALIEVLHEKGALLDRLAHLTQSVRDWSAVRETVPATERSVADELIAEANHLLLQAADAEHEAVNELKTHRDATQQELREISAAGQVHTAYRDSLAPATHRSLDVDR